MKNLSSLARTPLALACTFIGLAAACSAGSAATHTLSKLEVVTVKFHMGGLDAAANVVSSNRVEVGVGTTDLPSDWSFSWDTGSFSYQGNLKITLPPAFTAGDWVPLQAKADASWTTAGYGYDRRPGVQLSIGTEKVEKFTPNPIANGSFSVNDVELNKPMLTGSGQTGDVAFRIKMIAAYGPGGFGILNCCGSAVSVEVLATYADQTPRVTVMNLKKLCQPPCQPGPSYAFGIVPDQPAAGLFPAVPERPAELVTCIVTADVELREQGGNRDPVTVFVGDTLHADLDFVRLVSSLPQNVTSESGLGREVRFSGIPVSLPPGASRTTQTVRLEYQVQFNVSANTSVPPDNTVTCRVVDTVTGTTLQEASASTSILPMIPDLEVDLAFTRTAGLPGDRVRVTVIVRNANSQVALEPTVDLTLPAGVTLDPRSVNPPAGPIPGGGPGLRWLAPAGAIPDGGVDRYVLEVTIDPLVPQDTVLPFTVSAQGLATHPCVPANTRQVNALATKQVVVSPIRVGLDVDLSASPTRGCWPQIVTYTARIANIGEMPLEEVTLIRRAIGTVGLPSNPPFPWSLEPLAAGETRVVTYRGQIDRLATRLIPLVEVVQVTGSAYNQGVLVAPPVGPVGAATVLVMPPFIQSIQPPSAPPGTMDLHVRISGFCFVPGATLRLQRSDGTEVTEVRLSDPDPPLAPWQSPIEMWRKMTIAPEAAPGEIQFVVTNPSGDVGGQPPYNVFVIGAQPRIAEIEPISAPALALLTIRGANFGATIPENTVRFGNTPAELVAASRTELVARVPEGLPQAAVPVTVTVQGQVSNPAQFVYVPPAVVIPSIHNWLRMGIYAQLPGPVAIVVHPQGTLYVLVRGGSLSRVERGRLVTPFLDLAGAAQGWSALAQDSAGNLYAANRTGGEILRVPVPSQGTVLPTQFAAGISQVAGLAVDAAGNVYATSLDTGTVYKISPAGDKTEYATGLASPGPVALAEDGTLFVGCQGNRQILRLGPGEASAVPFADLPGKPIALSVAPRGGLLAGTEGDTPGAGRLYAIDPLGQVAVAGDGFSQPGGLAFDAARNLYVADAQHDRVYQAAYPTRRPLAEVTPPSLSFGEVDVGQQPALSVTLRNLGTDSLEVASVGSTSPPFSVAPAAPFTVPSGQAQTLTVTFKPTSAGFQSGLITLQANDPEQPVVEVAASGIGRLATLRPELRWEPAVLDFGSVAIGQGSEREVTIRNEGHAVLAISGLTSSDAQFGVWTAVPLQVAPGAAQGIRIRFRPTAAGLQQATLAITSNDPDQARVEVTVRGNGAPGRPPAAIRFYCLSLRVPPATFPLGGETYTAELTGGFEEDPVNGELAPTFAANDPMAGPAPGEFSHASELRIRAAGQAVPVARGALFVDLPDPRDANGNGYPDFFETSQAVAPTATAGLFSDFQETPVELTWARAAGASQGTVQIQLDLAALGPLSFEAGFALLEYSGTLDYSPGTNQVTATMRLTRTGSASQVLSGPVVLTKGPGPGDPLRVVEGKWTDEKATEWTYLEGQLQRRTAGNYFGVFELLDGDPTSALEDYRLWAASIDDPNDTDGDGTSDLVDDPGAPGPTTGPTLSVAQAGAMLRLRIRGDVGQAFILEESRTLRVSDWSPSVSGTLKQDPETLELPLPDAGSKFYRVRMLE